MPEVNPELEAAIVHDPDDLSSYAVYGDWLVERGDPRGELIATQLAAEATGDPEMRRAALRVFARHRGYFLGELDDLIAVDAFTWRAGFIQRAQLAYSMLLVVDGAPIVTTMAEVVGKLLAHPSTRFLTDLEIQTMESGRGKASIHDQHEIVSRIVTARPPLRRLQLGGPGSTRIGSLADAWPALRELRELVLCGTFQLGDIDLPELRRVVIMGSPVRKLSARALVAARWPRLESLDITFEHHAPEHVGRELHQLVARTDLSSLVSLRLVRLPLADTFLKELASSGLLAQLRELDVSESLLTDRGLRTLLANLSAFRHLTKLDISRTRCSRTMSERVRHSLPALVLGEPLEP